MLFLATHSTAPLEGIAHLSCEKACVTLEAVSREPPSQKSALTLKGVLPLRKKYVRPPLKRPLSVSPLGATYLPQSVSFFLLGKKAITSSEKESKKHEPTKADKPQGLPKQL
jgi:hypothetical protein